MKISDTIKQLRKQNYLTQAAFAKKVAVTQGTVSQWENDLTSPSLPQLKAISEAFDVSIDDIIGEKTIRKSIELTKTEYKLIQAYRKADRVICEAVLAILESSASSQ